MLKTYLTALLIHLSGLLFAQQFNLVGSATSQSCSCYQLTPNSSWNSGAVWNNNQINLTQDFDFNFQVFLGCNDGGADGIAFVLQNSNTGFASNGGGLGYQGFPNQSVAIELDTYQNSNYGDPATDHIALESNGNVNHNLVAPLPASATTVNIEDCQWHDFRVVWNVGTQTISAYFDGAFRFNYTFPGGIINAIFGGNPGNIFWGFTGGTGQLSNQQQFCLNLQASFQTGNNFVVCGLNPIAFTSTSSSGLNSIQGYAWNFGDGNTSALQNPTYTYSATGVYQVTLTITDQSLCTSTITQTVTVYDQGTVNFSVTPDCSNAGNGSVLFTVSGGTNPFITYLSGSTTNIINAGGNQWLASGLITGSYSFILMDQNGCSDTLIANVPVSQNLPVINVQQVTPVLCSGDATGSIQLAVNGGTSPYLFSCNTSVNNSGQFSGLSGGLYQVSVTDSIGCADSTTVVLPDTIPPIVLSIQSYTEPMCFNATDGLVSLAAQGGTSPYLFNFNQGASGASSTFNNLGSGLYSFVVIDHYGCTDSLAFQLNEPTPLQIQSTQYTSPTCPAGQDGSAFVICTGGTGTYTYNWNGAGAGNAAQINQLGAGNFSVIVTDQNGCSLSQSFNLTDPIFFMQSIPDYLFCTNTDTAIAPSITGGSTPLSILWNVNGAASNSLVLDNFSTYSTGINFVMVNISDANGCMLQDSFHLELLPVPDVRLNLSADSACGNYCSGFSVIQADTPATYTWNFGDGTTAHGNPTANYILRAL